MRYSIAIKLSSSVTVFQILIVLVRQAPMKMAEFELRHIRFKHPFTALVAGPTSSGKTVFVRRLLKNFDQLTNIPVAHKLKVTYCYGQFQEGFNEPIPSVDIKYEEGLVDEQYVKDNKPHIIVIDDLMTELGSDSGLTSLFTKGSHHLGVSIIFIVQNIFHQGKEMRNISLNCHYIIALKNPRDRQQILTLGRQLYPKKAKDFQAAFEMATKSPYSYLLIDLRVDTPDELRLRSRILPEESIKGRASPIIYVIK